MGCVCAMLVAYGTGRSPMKAMREKEGGTRFSQCVLDSVGFVSRLGYVHFCLSSQSMDRLKRALEFL